MCFLKCWEKGFCPRRALKDGERENIIGFAKKSKRALWSIRRVELFDNGNRLRTWWDVEEEDPKTGKIRIYKHSPDNGNSFYRGDTEFQQAATGEWLIREYHHIDFLILSWLARNSDKTTLSRILSFVRETLNNPVISESLVKGRMAGGKKRGYISVNGWNGRGSYWSVTDKGKDVLFSLPEKRLSAAA